MLGFGTGEFSAGQGSEEINFAYREVILVEREKRADVGQFAALATTAAGAGSFFVDR